MTNELDVVTVAATGMTDPHSAEPADCGEPDVLRIRDTGWSCLDTLFNPAGLTIARVDDNQPIPGSHWGDEEAGLIGYTLYAREDTPIHSVFHEACHWLFMSEERRARLHTDAKGSAVEEMAVCYLQILLSDLMPGMTRERMFLDMDRWGYSFRVGGTEQWFKSDAEDALDYLAQHLPHTHGITGLFIDVPGSRVLQQHDDG